MSHAEAWAQDALPTLEARGHLRELIAQEGPQGPTARIRGRDLISFCSNDYLGLAGHHQLRESLIAGVRDYGVGAGASRLVTGGFVAHESLEHSVSQWVNYPCALVFNSGYAANVGVLSGLPEAGDAIFSDQLNHASIVDGCRLSKAHTVVYPHADVAALDTLMQRTEARRKWLVTDSIFSMDGDRAPLRELAAVARKHAAAFVVDDAHALGVCGPLGNGLCAEERVRPDLLVGTFSKALGSVGGFVATTSNVRSWLFHRARSLVYSTALPPALCVAAQTAVALAQEPARRAKLWNNIQRLSQELTTVGGRRGSAESSSAIFSLRFESARRAVQASEMLYQRGILVRPIRPPTVPEGTSRLRITASAAHRDEHLDALSQALRSLESLR